MLGSTLECQYVINLAPVMSLGLSLMHSIRVNFLFPTLTRHQVLGTNISQELTKWLQLRASEHGLVRAALIVLIWAQP